MLRPTSCKLENQLKKIYHECIIYIWNVFRNKLTNRFLSSYLTPKISPFPSQFTPHKRMPPTINDEQLFFISLSQYTYHIDILYRTHRRESPSTNTPALFVSIQTSFRWLPRFYILRSSPFSIQVEVEVIRWDLVVCSSLQYTRQTFFLTHHQYISIIF